MTPFKWDLLKTLIKKEIEKHSVLSETNTALTWVSTMMDYIEGKTNFYGYDETMLTKILAIYFSSENFTKEEVEVIDREFWDLG